MGASVEASIPLEPAQVGDIRQVAGIVNTNPNSDPASNASQSARLFVRQAFQRWRMSDTYDKDLRRDQREDLDFFSGKQWPDTLKAQRDKDGRPCLTINRIAGYARQIVNESRDARPGIEVDAVDNAADVYTAETLQGLIQHVESNSDADVAYTRAVQAQARVGRGWFRILPEYASDNTFEQELRIKSVRNFATVYPDPVYQELDGSDMRFAFIVDDLPCDEYDELYGESSPRATIAEMTRSGEVQTDWMPTGRVRIAEYYSFRRVKKTLCLMENGECFEQDELEDAAGRVVQHLKADGVSLTPKEARTVQAKQLTWCKMNAVTILEGNKDLSGPRDMPGRWIPVFPVVGEEVDLDGRVDYKGITRDAKDPQRMANYQKSAMTEKVALLPKAPYIAEEGQLEGHEKDWAAANIRNLPVLKYKKVSIGGNTLVPAPQRADSTAPIQGEIQLSLQAEQDLRATAGFSIDVGAHEQRAEQSGRAILARQHQGEVGNSHFQANLAVALRHAGRVLLDLFPWYYDTPRVKRILGRDGKSRTVIVHAGNATAAKQMLEQQKQTESELKIVDLSAGRYDVRVKAGVSYSSQRQQDRELMTAILQADPTQLARIGDLYFDDADTPVGRKIAARYRKALPPELRDDEEGGQPELPPGVLQQMQKAQKFIDLQAARINELTEAIQTKALELSTREKIAAIQATAMIVVAQSKTASAETIALLQGQLQQIQHLTDIDRARIEAISGLGAPASPGGTGEDGQATRPPAAVSPGASVSSPVLPPSAPVPTGPVGSFAGEPPAQGV
ncbi:hypothetical protein LLG88_13735 [bacterium]|nr:hypothetical protein [bacterium]